MFLKLVNVTENNLFRKYFFLFPDMTYFKILQPNITINL